MTSRVLVVATALALSLVACGKKGVQLAPRSQTFAELRTVRAGVTVAAPGEKPRAPYPRERLVDGSVVKLEANALAWLRRDGGEALLLSGPGEITVTSESISVAEGKLFVDAPRSSTLSLSAGKHDLRVADTRASIEVHRDGSLGAYVLRGGVRLAGDSSAQAGAGELLLAPPGGKPERRPVAAWEDWTGGLASTDRTASPPPFGVGTVGARPPGDQGSPRTPLAVHKLEVRVKIEHDFALTEVDQVFFNPSSETVEGIYSFRTPEGATLHRFGVDRDGDLVWGRVKEKAAAAAQYQSHVYAGSTEDPALLEWDAPGVYRAKLYPIGPGASRRVVTRYGEWLGRHGDHGERRLYVYPMAAEGAEGSLPRIEELTLSVDLGKTPVREVRAGMAAVRDGKTLTVRAYDVVPRADFSLELLDDGPPQTTAYRSVHRPDLETLPPDDRAKAERDAAAEADYLMVPVRAGHVEQPKGGLDVVLVVDASAATESSSLALSRAFSQALLAHLGPDDRVAVVAADVSLRPVIEGAGALSKVDPARREALSMGLSRLERGGATDLASVLVDAASTLDPSRRGAVVYVGDGKPTVGEQTVAQIRTRLSRLPRPVRLFTMGVGEGADMGVLSGIARGGFSERLVDGHGAARTALRLLEELEQPLWLGVSVSLGLGVDRVYPRDLPALDREQSALLVGRVNGFPKGPAHISSWQGKAEVPFVTIPIDDDGDLRRRWAEGRLVQLLDEGAGRAAVVEVGARYGIITPFTSLYVPTSQEARVEKVRRAQVEREEQIKQEQKRKEKPGFFAKKSDEAPSVAAAASAFAPPPPPADMEVDAPADKRPMAKSPAKPIALPPLATATAAAGPAKGGGRGPSGDVGFSGPASPEPAPMAKAEVSKVAELSKQLADAKDQAATATIQQQLNEAKNAPAQAAAPSANMAGPAGFGGGKAARKAAPGDPLAGLDDDVRPANAKKVAPARGFQQAAFAVNITLNVDGSVGHRAFACGQGALLPLDERRQLWRERLSAQGRSPHGALSVYRDALGRCEAQSWFERTVLLHAMVDALPSVQARVSLYRLLFAEKSAAEVIYQAILARLRTTQELRDFHAALGLRRVDQSVLEKKLAEAKTPADRVTALRSLSAIFPDDTELSLLTLDALEDADMLGDARSMARTLRRRRDSSARVRTSVGELYLRLGKRPGAGKEDELEARRTFGEIVEFAHDDPVARRRLGDLCAAHGWFAEAFRHYETLQSLSPHDPAVFLLLGRAAQGEGRVEEAIRWTERAAQAFAPDPTSPTGRISRSLSRTFLAWAELSANDGGRADEAAALRQRAEKLSSIDVPPGVRMNRVVLTWMHPDLHPELWSSAIGAMMPAPDNEPLLGLSQVLLPSSAPGTIDVKLDRDDALRAQRLGADAVLTVIFDEGGPSPRVVRKVLRASEAQTSMRYEISGGAVKELPPSSKPAR